MEREKERDINRERERLEKRERKKAKGKEAHDKYYKCSTKYVYIGTKWMWIHDTIIIQKTINMKTLRE